MCRNPFQSIVVRAVELLHAVDEALGSSSAYEQPDPPAVEVSRAPASGTGSTEAPRGLLYHRYEIDDDGTILDARIVPPTSQNQRRIEEDLRARSSSGSSQLPDDAAAAALRADDPQLRPVHLVRDPLPQARGRAPLTLVIGVGNRWRHDDGAGLEVGPAAAGSRGPDT